MKINNRQSIKTNVSKDWSSAQIYGILDDAALFNHALSNNEFAYLINNKRLKGTERGLVKGWSFDKKPTNSSINPKLHAYFQNNNQAYHVPLSIDQKGRV